VDVYHHLPVQGARDISFNFGARQSAIPSARCASSYRMTQRRARDSIYRRRRFEGEFIELCVRWYFSYRLSYRDLVIAHSLARRLFQAVGEVVACGSAAAASVGTSVFRRSRTSDRVCACLPQTQDQVRSCHRSTLSDALPRLCENLSREVLVVDSSCED
jgi:hypothetical protein